MALRVSVGKRGAKCYGAFCLPVALVVVVVVTVVAVIVIVALVAVVPSVVPVVAVVALVVLHVGQHCGRATDADSAV